MPSHPAQWIKKKGRRRPYKHGDFTCKPMYVVTACSHINLVFDMEKKPVGAGKKIFEKLCKVGLNDPWLMDLAEITEAFYAKLQTSDMHEFLGDHGGSLGCPPPPRSRRQRGRPRGAVATRR